MIYIVSDLHIDPIDGFFTPVKSKFHDFLDMVGDNYLIINGDLLDLWSWSLNNILSGVNKDIIERLKVKENVHLILGNHDLYPIAMRSVFSGPNDIKMYINIGPWKIFHGYQVDPVLDNPIERWNVATGARIIQALNWSWLNKIRDRLTKGERTNEPLIKALKEKNSNYILGHSHEALIYDGWYINEGCWSGNSDLTYCMIDENKQYSVELKTWK